LVSNLKTLSKKSGIEDVKEGANGIFDSIANSLIVNLKLFCLIFA